MKTIMIFFMIYIRFFTFELLASEKIEKPFLWEVSKGTKHFYLFGTIHMADSRLHMLPNKVSEAIKQSNIVCMEIPMDVATEAKSRAMMMRHDSKALAEVIPEKLYERAEKYLKTINSQLDLHSFEGLKIWALSTALILVENQLKYPTLPILDTIIFDEATRQNKILIGIETIEEQIGVMEQFTLSEQLAMLESTLEYLETHPDFIEETKRYYLKGNSRRLMHFILDSMSQNKKYKALEDKFIERLLYERNITMLRRIEQLLHDDPKKVYFFAFGVMHFLGDKSIVTYLQCNGYDVTKIE